MIEKKYSKIKKAAILAAGAVAFICLTVLTVIFSASDVPVIIGNIQIETYSMCGVLTAVQTMINITVVVCCKRSGFIQNMILYTLNILFLLVRIFIGGNISALPGLITAISSTVTVCILWRCLKDISEKKNELTVVTETDSLTNLPNRQSLNQNIERLIKDNTPFALAMVDIDNFKNINDAMGHDYGDEILKEITRRWNGVKRENDCLARLGGDEFAFIITDFKDMDNVKSRADRYMYCFKDKFIINGRRFYTTASMGISVFPEDSSDAIQLLKCADTAMYMAKQMGKHRVSFYNSVQLDDVISDMETEDFLRQVVTNEKFKLVFQPQFSAENNKLRGFEALLRIDAGDTLLQPKKYIQLAERLNIVTDIDRWVLQHAMNDFKAAAEVNPELKLSVNISVSYILDELFISDLKEYLKKSGLSPKNLELEITENLFASSAEKAKDILQEIRDIGVTVALDDFGTSYAAFKYLDTMSVDVIKIDREFVSKLGTDEVNNRFINGMISMGHILGCKIVSVGVENDQQRGLLTQFGSDCLQGFLEGKPVNLDSAMDLVYEDACR